MGAQSNHNGSLNEEEEGEEHHKDTTLQDFYFRHPNDTDSDSDTDDDHDWQPSNIPFHLDDSFCINCTMRIDATHSHSHSSCENCGEAMASQLNGYEAFQSQILNAITRYNASSSSSSTGFGFDERMLLHKEIEMKNHPHPERPDRLQAIAASLTEAGIFPEKCTLIPAREITREELLNVHSLDNVDSVEQTKNMFYSYFTPDTYANAFSACAAKLAAGICADLATSIMSGQFKNGFALVRPPGHHATITQAMGFCLHNNAAVAAIAAQKAGARKVLIVDWDVHHGNGTQEIFDGNKSVLYISLHRHEGGNFYPGTGAAVEVGTNGAEGFSVNIPWSCGGVGDRDYIFAFKNVVLPIAKEFAPDMTIISAGFDAARGDPLGGCDVTPAGYAQMVHMLTSLSDGKLLVVLEGGYNLRSISFSATAVVKVLLGEKPEIELEDPMPSKEGLDSVLQVLQVQVPYWPVLSHHYAIVKPFLDHFSSSSAISIGKQTKKRPHYTGLFWWKCGSKRIFFELISRRLQKKRMMKHVKGMR
ncbi:histone deacetylase [Rhynchospora pubera]|uniref:histone deacetylase n=1 Tax=Rhynchospora pubera TaxID=906938 RepID=A0AAV8GS32_9POAL|nr:histone deacetylase [Rhynchospora pubera]